jgi:hypothetical protein
MIIVDKINSILPTDNRAGSPLKHFAEVTLPLFDSLSPSSSSPGTLKAPFPLSRKLQLPISDDFCRHFTSYNYYNCRSAPSLVVITWNSSLILLRSAGKLPFKKFYNGRPESFALFQLSAASSSPGKAMPSSPNFSCTRRTTAFRFSKLLIFNDKLGFSKRSSSSKALRSNTECSCDRWWQQAATIPAVHPWYALPLHTSADKMAIGCGPLHCRQTPNLLRSCNLKRLVLNLKSLSA